MEHTAHLVTTDTPRRFVQIWSSEATGEWMVREGTLGQAGRVRETGLDPATAPSSRTRSSGSRQRSMSVVSTTSTATTATTAASAAETARSSSISSRESWTGTSGRKP
ncbi:hypothetical protein [Leucobacter chromiireducens]|uniref:hypothetical protein n=1 Tax=Leucobacter chromiireducens TaxID=283877 RepID=UPI001925186E|nr:hypothetical protein [Leucobacter chromiireducens]